MAAQRPGTPRKKDQTVNLETLGMEIGNKPPQAPDVEEAVLGAMLLEPSCVDLAMEELTPSCFYDPKHRMIFEAMSRLVTDHTSVDIITVSSELKAQGNLEAVGGTVVLANLSEKVGSAAHIEYYVKILKQKTIQRDLISASYDILRDSFDDSIKVDDLIDKAQSKVYDAIQSNVRREVQDIGSLINIAMSDIQEMQGNTGLNGVPCGFYSIDRITMGWQKSDLIILAARPSVGKTAFSLNLARNAAVDHHMAVAFFSLEMSAIQLVKRLITSESGLSADKIKGGAKLEDYEWEQLEYKLKALSKAPLYIDDTPGLPLMEFRTKGSRLPYAQGHGQGAGRADHRPVPALPPGRAAAGKRRQAAAVRPARVRLHRAGCRYGDLYPSPGFRGPQRESRRQRENADHHRQAPQRRDLRYRYALQERADPLRRTRRFAGYAGGLDDHRLRHEYDGKQ